jgi:hypothetical protein
MSDHIQKFISFADQLKAFNEQREREFGRGPKSDERLPLPFTMVGGDIPENQPEN